MTRIARLAAVTSLLLATVGLSAATSDPGAATPSQPDPQPAAPVAIVAPVPGHAQPSAVGLTDVDCPAPGDCFAIGSLTRAQRHRLRPLAEHLVDGTWTPTALPLPADFGHAMSATVTDLDCPSVDFCVAVGSYFDFPTSPPDRPSKERGHLLVETWDGQSWTASSPAVPADAYQPVQAGLGAVSCAGPSACTATGSYRTGLNESRILAATYDGTGWTTQTLPATGANAREGLDDIACRAADSCVAVGTSTVEFGTAPLLEVEVDGVWHASRSPLPADAESDGFGDARLARVSCSATTSCTAVGYYTVGRGPGTVHQQLLGLAVQIDGRHFTPIAVPPPVARPEKASSFLASVSCWNGFECLAGGFVGTGRTGSSSQRRGTLTRISGDGSVTDIPLGTNDKTGTIESVDCTPSGTCVAVGSATNSFSHTGIVSVVDHGVATTTRAPEVPGLDADPSPLAVALDSEHDAVAVGELYVGSGEDFHVEGLLVWDIAVP